MTSITVDSLSAQRPRQSSLALRMSQFVAGQRRVARAAVVAGAAYDEARSVGARRVVLQQFVEDLRH